MCTDSLLGNLSLSMDNIVCCMHMTVDVVCNGSLEDLDLLFDGLLCTALKKVQKQRVSDFLFFFCCLITV